MKTDSRFTYSDSQMREFAQTILDHARSLGAAGCECDVSEGFGLSVTVRKGEIDTLEHNRDKGIGVSVHFGSRPHVKRGHASTSDFSPAALRQTVEAAVAIARHTAEDDCAGLPEQALLARDLPDLDLYHPWHVSPEDAIEVARRCEAAAFALSPKLKNTEGTSLSAQHSQFVFANSLGFMAGFPTSRHSLGCSMIAEEKGQMQRDDWYSSARVPGQVANPEALGRYAGERALARLRARKIPTCQAPVLFEAPLASGLVGHFVSAVSGGSLYRKSTFLLDSLGKQVFSPLVSIEERPHEPQAMASSPFDEEGVATRERSIVRDGVVEGYFLGTYSARKLGMQSTGSAGGNHNLVVRPGTLDFRGMLKKLHRGLLVTELLGQGMNLITGDYSRGAAGYWVENGEIQYPVEEITIAGNLAEMFKSIAAVGNDVLVRGSRSSGSILVENMTIAGD
ncbi:MAG: metalloprotease PmbA [Proteobacteria bacterium]|nr:metalloprotease PmbA [Pseudomonadota bacterium]